MRIINNQYEKSHNETIKGFFEQSEEIYIASPFLMTDFNKFFNSLKLDNLKEITLVTTLKKNDVDQLKKAKSFENICPILNLKKIKFNLLINNKLHGKVYLFRKNNENIVGIITSANFTENGLEKNHEYGIEINDKNQLNELFKFVFDNSNNDKLSKNDIDDIIKKCDEFNKNNQKNTSQDNYIDLNLMDSFEKKDKIYTKGYYWLKPIGVTGEPIKNGEKFILSSQRLEFSKKKPSGIKYGDIIITYGVGTGKILSVYKNMSSEPKFVSDKELEKDSWRKRWPWSIEGKNLFQKYGGIWWKYNLHINELKDEFLKQYPNEGITRTGGKTLGCLNYGGDKICLAENFAKYLISKVSEIENDA